MSDHSPGHHPPADRDTTVTRQVAAALAHYQAVARFNAAQRSQRPMLALLAAAVAVAAATLLAGCGGGTDLAAQDGQALGPAPTIGSGPIVFEPTGDGSGNDGGPGPDAPSTAPTTTRAKGG